MRYHGGKWKMAKWIIEHLPQHRIYVEPFGGAGAVLLQKPRSHTEVYNDLWDDIVGVFRVLRDPKKAALLRQQCELTPFSRTEMLLSAEPIDDEIESARRIIFRSFSGFGSASANSLHKTGFRSNSRQSGSPPAIDWQNWPEHIESFTVRLQGVVIECRPALELIPQHDNAETLFYLDPPYVHSTRGMRRRNAAYRHEMTDSDHRDLAAVLYKIEGMAILSGYRCELYDELYRSWRRFDRRSFADGATKRIESIWLNEPALKHGQQHLELGD
jgi:DNA adenine methylase